MLKRRLLNTVFATSAAVVGLGAAQAQVEVIEVTSTKTEADSQSIPVALNAVSATTLDELNITSFDDYVRYLPNVTFGGRGPGQNTVYIRGMAVQPISVLLSGAQGTSPNVAFYLDEQPVTAPGRNLDIYAADLQRIEVLPGPQGTLFGASSQAGTIRLITNRPDYSGFGAGFDASFGFTEGGEESTGVEAYINLPITDQFALRGVVYSINQGGYIDNVPGTFTTDPSINPDSTAIPDAVSYEVADNALLVEEDFNDSSYEGFRLSGAYLFNDDWELIVQHTNQTLEADGVFDYDPEVGDLQVSRFFRDSLTDEFGLTTWTLEGRLGMLDAVYTGGYLDREINQSVDYTGYNNSGAFISYYTCTYTSTGAGAAADAAQAAFLTPGGRECLDPTKGAVIFQEQTRNTHEFRISTPQEYRFRLTAGVFYDDFEIQTQDDFFYLATADLGFAPNAPIAAANSINPNARPAGVAFFNDITRSEEQIAVFGEATFDIIPNTLSATFGARYYDIDSDFTGSSNFANGVFTTPEIALDDQDSGRDYDVSGGHTPEPLNQTDTIYRFTLSWTPNDDLLLYGTWSEGFRPGGFNRGGGLASVNPAFPTVETTYGTDDVTNWEFGWKSLWSGGDLLINGNVYFIEWSDMQVSRFDPENVSILTFIENAADSEIFGIEADAVWTATENITLFGALSYNDTELTDVSAQIVELAPIGSELPLVPEFQATARARYDWMIGDYDAFGQVGFQYAGESFSSLIEAVRERQDSYFTTDLSAGFGRDGWRAEVFIENLTDERAELFINEQDDIRRITTNRPRTVTFRVSADF